MIEGEHQDYLKRIEAKIDGYYDWYSRIESRVNHIVKETDLLVSFVQDITTKLVALNTKVDALMAVADDIKAAIANLDAETTAVAANIAAIAAKIKNSMTDTEVADIQTAFGLLSDRLTGLAQDPTAPVPAPAPALAALRKKL